MLGIRCYDRFGGPLQVTLITPAQMLAMVDTTGDGIIDTLAIDTTGDGDADVVVNPSTVQSVDTNGDGIADSVLDTAMTPTFWRANLLPRFPSHVLARPFPPLARPVACACLVLLGPRPWPARMLSLQSRCCA